MRLTERLAIGLKGARQMTDGLLASFKTPEQWTHQVHGKANHALWFVGHIGLVDNFFLSGVAPGKVRIVPGYDEKFGMGSKPTSNPGDYPAVDEVLAYMRERREALLAVLKGMSDEDLDTRMPEGTPDFIPTYGAAFQLAPVHEAFHLGQVSIAARALGVPPRI
ncbi:MAG: DinB family protein [Phycisphaerae bacterium]|nr:DinB family protein [Phycisphaerae bacterium]